MKLPAYQLLSKEQDGICNLPLDSSFLVTGPPGTGKTVLALYRAQQLSRQQRKCRVLMFSNLLSLYVRRALSELKLNGQVTTYHKWVFSFYQEKTGERWVPTKDKYVFDWLKILEKVGASLQGVKDTDLLVDEGQDLPKEFYLALPFMGRTYTVFADENQRITGEQTTLNEIRQYAQIKPTQHRTLTRNYRNTKEIALLAREFYTGLQTGIPDLPVTRGDLPVMRRTASFDAMIEWIARYANLNSDLEIGIFVQTNSQQDKIMRALKKYTMVPVQSYTWENKGRHLDFDNPGVKLIAFASIKGLEFDTVFIPELQDVTLDTNSVETRMLLYVLLSRARRNLFLSYSGTDQPPIVDLFPRALMEWRI